MNCIIRKFFRQLTGKKSEITISKDDFLVDVRTVEEFAQGSVSNAINIPLDQIETELSQFKNKKNIVVFCKSGIRSERAKNILTQHGVTNVINGGGYVDVQNSLNQH